MQKILKIILTFSMVTMLGTWGYGQFGGGGAPGTGSAGGSIPRAGVPEAPFDGGMSLILLASGVGYVVKQRKQVEK